MERRGTNICRILMEKPERHRPLGRPKCRLMHNVKTKLREVGWDGMD
jgi:hypothetical protein